MTERKVLAGTDGFRDEARLGEAGPGLVNEETFALMTAALVLHQRDTGNNGPVVVGADTRSTSEPLLRAVIAGARSQGADVVNLEVAPTPMVQRVAGYVGAAASVVVTASHNPEGYNGWKGMIRHRKPTPAENQTISDTYWDMVEDGFKVNLGEHTTDRMRINDLVLGYRRAIEGETRMSVDRYRPLDNKLIVVDGAYGAAQSLTADILKTLGARVEMFACDRSGAINDGCGAADLSGIKRFILENNFHLDPGFLGGIANDGDADRMLAIGVTDVGGETELVELSGNHVMWAMAEGQPGFVGTEYTNTALVNDLLANNIGFDYCKNGDTNVTAGLRARQQGGYNWKRGGEFTGHYVDIDWLTSGDGIRMAAWFSNWAVMRGMNFGTVHRALPLWHEEMRQVHINGVNKTALQSDRQINEAVLDIQSGLGRSARFILRASGTEPVFRIWGESTNQTAIKSAVDELEQVVQHRADAIAA